MAEIKKGDGIEIKNAQVTRELREASVSERPIYKSVEAPTPITGKLPETPKRPPKK